MGTMLTAWPTATREPGPTRAGYGDPDSKRYVAAFTASQSLPLLDGADEADLLHDDTHRGYHGSRVWAGTYAVSGPRATFSRSYRGWHDLMSELCQVVQGRPLAYVLAHPERYSGTPFYDLFIAPSDEGVYLSPACARIRDAFRNTAVGRELTDVGSDAYADVWADLADLFERAARGGLVRVS